MDQRVSLIIPNWNGEAFLPGCLDSLARQSLKPLEVFVVDNGSTDGSVALVRGNYPWVEVLELAQNYGFAAAVNRGILASSGGLIALLNNDTELDARWLAELVRGLTAKPQAGSAACRMLRFDDRSIIDAAGDGLTRGAAPVSRGTGEPGEGRYASPEYIFGACAGAALYRADVFQRVGRLDEDFVSYYEDADWSFRAQLAGFRCVYIPTAICYHKRGATSARLPGYPIRMQERNLTALHVKNLPWPLLMRILPMVLFSRVRRLWREIWAGVGGPAFRGLFDGILLIPGMLGKRREVQRLNVENPLFLLGFMRGTRP